MTLNIEKIKQDVTDAIGDYSCWHKHLWYIVLALISRLETAEKQRDELASALQKASDTFCHYAAIHAAKEPADMVKADANNALHEMCESALASIKENGE